MAIDQFVFGNFATSGDVIDDGSNLLLSYLKWNEPA